MFVDFSYNSHIIEGSGSHSLLLSWKEHLTRSIREEVMSSSTLEDSLDTNS
jgi:hypothetical protein